MVWVEIVEEITVGDGLVDRADNNRHPSGVSFPSGGTDLAQCLLEQVSDPNPLVMLDHVCHDEGSADEVLQRPRCGAAQDGILNSGVGLVDDRGGHRFLGREVVVERALRDSGPVDDVGQSGLAVTDLVEQVDGGVDDPLPRRLGPGLDCHDLTPRLGYHHILTMTNLTTSLVWQALPP